MLSTHQEWRYKKQGKDIIPYEILKEDFALVALLKSCIKNKDLGRGTKLHAHMLKVNLLERNPYLATTLINMYAKCGMIEKAKQVLEDIPNRDIVAWCALISGYTKQDRGYEALNCFERMQSEGLSPDAIILTSILKACGNIKAAEKGQEIHSNITPGGLLETNIIVGTALVGMYMKCGLPAKAQEIFNKLTSRNVISWNTLLSGYAEQGQGHNAFICLKRMQSEGLSPDIVTFTCILKACGRIGTIGIGIQVHEEIVRKVKSYILTYTNTIC